MTVRGAAAQARRMLDVLEQRYPGAAQELASDPLRVLRGWPDIAVEFVGDDPLDSDGQRCSVAGSYRHEFDPPKLQVARSASPGRRQFTALHELGHHLQRTDDDLGDAVAAAHDYERFEDAACDAFASQILISDDLFTGIVDRRGPTAGDVVALFEQSKASRAACCVRAAESLTGLGMVVLYDSEGVVSFAARKGVIPPARGTDQSQTPLVRKALSDPQRTAAFEMRAWVTYRNTSRSDAYFAQAAWCDGYVVAVYADTNPAWQALALPETTTPNTWVKYWDCETCSESFPIDQSCRTCNTPLCLHGHCRCTGQREQLCTGCFLTKHRSQFPAGSTACTECAA